MRTILLVTASLLTVPAFSRTIMNKKTPILFYKSKHAKLNNNNLSSNAFERVILAADHKLSSDRYGINLRSEVGSENYSWFDYLAKGYDFDHIQSLSFWVSCEGNCEVKVKTRCEKGAQEIPKTAPIWSKALYNRKLRFAGPKIKLNKESCPGGVYQSLGFKLSSKHSAIHILSIRPIIEKLNISKKSTKKDSI